MKDLEKARDAIGKMRFKPTTKIRHALILIDGKNQNTVMKPKVLGIYQIKQFICEVSYFNPAANGEGIFNVIVVDFSDKKNPEYKLDLSETVRGADAVEALLAALESGEKNDE